MPHYSDGTPAQIGDDVVGKPYNTDHTITGKVVQLVPDSEACNLVVAFVDDKPGLYQWVNGYQSFNVFRDNKQQQHFLTVKTDYGETKAFTLVHRAGMEHEGGPA